MVDSHAHLQFLSIGPKEAVSRALDNGVKYILCVAVESDDNRRILDISESFDNVFCSVGIHPLSRWKEEDLKYVEDFSKEAKVVAIGETGLDFYRTEDVNEIERQIELFRFHICLALRTGKPLVIHTRGVNHKYGSAFDVCFDMLKKFECKSAVFHSFSWSEFELKKAQDNGFFTSFSGMVTYSKKIQRCLKVSDIEKTIVETDSPFLSPVRGRENEPSYVRFIVEKISEIREESFEELSQVFIRNFERIFLR